MNYFGRIVSGIKGYYSEINSATLTGAIDVIVVRQDDGSFIGSPFHVRFGKIGVLRSREKVVDIKINDEPVDLHMKLGEAGEAFFVEPCEDDVPHYLCTSPIPDAESLMSEGLEKMKQEIKEIEQQQCDNDSQPESSNDLVVSSKSIIEITSEQQKDSDNDSSGDNIDILITQENERNLDTREAVFVKRSDNISVPGKWDDHRSINQTYNAAPHRHLNEYYSLSDLDSPISSPHQQSPVNTQPPSPQRYSSDTEVNYQSKPVDRTDNSENQMTWNWGRLPQGIDAKPSTERKHLSELKKESKKAKHKSGHKVVAQEMYLDDLESVDKDIANLYLQQAGNCGPISDSSKEDNDSCNIDIDPIKSDSELNKSDGESGIGSSLPVSQDETSILESEPYNSIEMSLCGELRRGKVSLERFMESMVSFEDFSKDPSQILSDPNLVVRVDDRYYNWNVAVPMLISHVVYQKPLRQTSVDALMKEHMPKKAKRRGYSSWFSAWRSPPEHNESTDEDCQETERERWTNENMDETESDKPDSISSELLQEIPETSVEIEMDSLSTETYKKVLELSSEQLETLNLKEGANEVTFSVTTKYQGTASCTASIFLYNYNDKIIISDIDGTITKSDVLGQILPASFWAQLGVTKLFSTIQKNGYKFMYLSARAIGQAELTRQHLKNVIQENLGLPNGPMFLSPSSLIKAFHREIIEKKPEEFKIQCLRNIRELFPPKSVPFFAGFGNKINDVLSYRAVGIPVQKIFTVNHKGEVKNEFTNAFQSSYTAMQDLVDQMFPPFSGYVNLLASDEFSTFTFWRIPIAQLPNNESLSTLVDQTETVNSINR